MSHQVVTSMVVSAAILLGWNAAAAHAQADSCAAIPPSEPIVEVGAFSDMRYTEEHAYGCTVMLWRAGPCLFGLFESSQGLVGDTPIGTIQDVTYDSKTDSLSFAARLTTGMVTLQGFSEPQPARDLFTFRGKLTPSRLVGVVTHELLNHPQSPPARNDVVLDSSENAAEMMPGPATHGDWLERWRPILEHRGPRW